MVAVCNFGGVCFGVMDSCGRLESGVGGGSFMAGGVSKVCQRYYWERWLSCRSGGCFWCTQHKCRTVLLCLNVLLCLVVVIFA